MMAMIGLGAGMIISAFTTKYRDLIVVLSFAVSLLMYLSAVPYPVSEAKLKFPSYVADFVVYNPMTQIIEGIRYMILGSGTFSWFGFVYTLCISLTLFFVGLIIFNRTEKNFIDTV